MTSIDSDDPSVGGFWYSVSMHETSDRPITLAEALWILAFVLAVVVIVLAIGAQQGKL